jgi:hypothetical protein
MPASRLIESLHHQQHDGDHEDHELARLVEDPERHDQRRGARRRVRHASQHPLWFG